LSTYFPLLSFLHIFLCFFLTFFKCLLLPDFNYIQSLIEVAENGYVLPLINNAYGLLRTYYISLRPHIFLNTFQVHIMYYFQNNRAFVAATQSSR